MAAGQKLFVNQTSYSVSGTITVRQGQTPGIEAGTVQMSLAPNAQQMVVYGNNQNPFVDQLTLTALTDGGGSIIISDQVIMVRGTSLDNMFNTNDTIYINVSNESFLITAGNTWT